MPGAAWILFGGTFLNRFGSFVLTFLVLYLTRRGFSPAEAGIAVAAYGGGSLAAAAVGGVLADRLGRRRTIALSMFGSATTMMLLSQARPLWLVAALVGVAGLTAETYRPASSALLADIVPEERRVTAYALYRLAINAGFAAGPAVAGLLAERSFFFLFVVDAATSAAFGTIALIALPEGTRSDRAAERRGEARRAMLADRGFLLFLVATVAGALVYLQSTTTFPLHVRDSGLSEAAYGLLISLNGALIVLIELPITAFTGRLPAREVIAAGFLVVGVGFGLTSLAHSLPALAATVVVWTLGEIIGAPVGNAYVVGLAPQRLRGRYMGAVVMTYAVSFVIGPAAGAAVYGWSPSALWVGCAILGVVAAALMMAAPRRRVTPSVAVPEPGPEIPGIET
jgi:MFS family permease